MKRNIKERLAAVVVLAVLVFAVSGLVIGTVAATDYDCRERGTGLPSVVNPFDTTDYTEQNAHCDAYGDMYDDELADNETLDMSEVYTQAGALKDGQTSKAALRGNYLRDSDGTMSTIVRYTAWWHLRDGDGVTEAKLNASNQVVDWYSRFQKNSMTYEHGAVLKTRNMVLDMEESDLDDTVTISTYAYPSEKITNETNLHASVSEVDWGPNTPHIIDSENFDTVEVELYNGETKTYKIIRIRVTLTVTDGEFGYQTPLTYWQPVTYYSADSRGSYASNHITEFDSSFSDKADNSTGDTIANISGQEMDVSLTFSAPTDSQNATMFYDSYWWRDHLNNVDSRKNYWVDNSQGMVNAIYDNHTQAEAQKIPWSSGILSGDEYRRFFANNYESTGHYSAVVGYMMSEGGDGNVSAGMRIDTDGDTSTVEYSGNIAYWGTIPTDVDGDGQGEWLTNHTYDTSDFDMLYFAAQQDDGTVDTVRLDNITSNFTIVNATNLVTGESISVIETTTTRYENASYTNLNKTIRTRETIRTKVIETAGASGGSIWDGAFDSDLPWLKIGLIFVLLGAVVALMKMPEP